MDSLILPPDDEGFDRRALFGAADFVPDAELLPGPSDSADPLPEPVEDDGDLTQTRRVFEENNIV